MSIEHRENPPQRELIVTTVDLSKGWDTESMRDILIERLKELGIYQPNLLFRGFDGNKIEVIKQHGTDIPDDTVIFCSTEGQLVDEYAMEESALDFSLGQEKAGLAVYDGARLFKDSSKYGSGYEYQPKKGTSFKEALLAVLILE
ncbi:MAG TPA: hypothetical protein VMX18_01305 [Candidatus Bipolaricaulota bacterium]|nr:hypothetical protein [Candidatus Bipolaricaulota bacterium]